MRCSPPNTTFSPFFPLFRHCDQGPMASLPHVSQTEKGRSSLAWCGYTKHSHFFPNVRNFYLLINGKRKVLGWEQVIRGKRERSGENVCCVYFSRILVHWAWLTWGQIWKKISLWAMKHWGSAPQCYIHWAGLHLGSKEPLVFGRPLKHSKEKMRDVTSTPQFCRIGSHWSAHLLNKKVIVWLALQH